MALWKLTLSYDGTAFHGWQIQPALPTVQGTLASAIRHITGEVVLPQGSGRTDAGVHALAQVASLALRCSIPAANLHRALNRHLPPSIRILSAQIVDPPFHARHSAIGKTYEYRVFPAHPVRLANPGETTTPSMTAAALDRKPVRHNRPVHHENPNICPPMLAPYAWDLHFPLDLALLNSAAAHILGPHDFTSFAAVGAEIPGSLTSEPIPGYPVDPPTPRRTIHHSRWEFNGQLLIYRVTGSGFLHHMVRNLVGTFVEVGRGRISPDAIPPILAARSRSAAGPTAPARGLFLVHVEYP